MKQFNLETQCWEGEDDEPLNSLQYLQSIYRDENQPPSMRIRCAVEALPFENPKLSATAISTMDGKNFAEALDRAIERSKKPLPLAAPVLEHEASELRGPMPRLVRRF